MLQQLYNTYLQSHKVTTDSRQVTPGCIFFALKGEHFDGNTFAPQALQQGAALCVVDAQWKNKSGQWKNDPRLLAADNVLLALQQLAALHRSHLHFPFIAITGTNGKTTTKELISAVLSKRYRTHATLGNLNNHIGVPLTILSIPQNTEIAVIEMGANHPGEIETLCRIADPDCGIITNVGRAHLQGFGSLEGVFNTKTELYRHLAAKHGLVFVNADNTRLMHEAERLATIPGLRSAIPAYAPDNPAFIPSTIERTPLSLLTYGRNNNADIRGTLVKTNPQTQKTETTSPLQPPTSDPLPPTSPYLHFYFEVADNVYNIHTHLLGDYNLDNCLAATAVGLHFGVQPFDIKEALEQYSPSNNRSQYKKTARGNHLYLDCYNANPSSMAAAIDSFKNMGGNMAVIGGMHELGSEQLKEHQRLVEQLAECHLDLCLLVGHEFDGIPLPKNMLLFPDTEHLRSWLPLNSPSNATILVKGSNTNRLWTLEELL